MRLIDADALEYILREKAYGYKASMLAIDCNIARVVALECALKAKDAPTVDAEPVRHGEWLSALLVDQKWRVIVEQYKCSLCGRQEYQKEPYCHCGARMDGGKHETENKE